MSWKAVERRVFPEEHLCAICHVLVPEMARAHCMNDDAGSLAGNFKVNPHRTSIPVSFGRLVRWRFSQARKGQDRHRLSQDKAKVSLDIVLFQLGHGQDSRELISSK
jgi:hypothetical protein